MPGHTKPIRVVSSRAPAEGNLTSSTATQHERGLWAFMSGSEPQSRPLHARLNGVHDSSATAGCPVSYDPDVGCQHTPRAILEMSQDDPYLRDFAAILVEYEVRRNRSAAIDAPLRFHACEKLRPSLATLMGDTGSHALFSRALVLASADAPWLRDMQLAADGTLQGSRELEARLEPRQIVEGMVALLFRLLGLLVAFIGENLTRQLVHEIWPQLPVAEIRK